MSRTFGPYTWVTDSLAVGPAPMSAEHFALLHQAGIGAILNLCAEFPQLPERQREAGFEVYYLPIPDEEAPALDALEQALTWLDEALYLGKKVLIHCRFGIGRTGTVLNAYFLRRGLGHGRAWWALRKLRSQPANFAQWRAVRRYGRGNPSLKAEAPRVSFACYLDLSPIWQAYAGLVDGVMAQAVDFPQCGVDHDGCCRSTGDLGLVEAAALARFIDTHLESHTRRRVMVRAAANLRREKRARRMQLSGAFCLVGMGTICPLLAHGRCLVPLGRPIACRLWGVPSEKGTRLWEEIAPAMRALDEQIMACFTEEGLPAALPRFSFAEVVSGEWVHLVFAALAEKKLAKDPSIS